MKGNRCVRCKSNSARQGKDLCRPCYRVLNGPPKQTKASKRDSRDETLRMLGLRSTPRISTLKTAIWQSINCVTWKEYFASRKYADTLRIILERAGGACVKCGSKASLAHFLQETPDALTGVEPSLSVAACVSCYTEANCYRDKRWPSLREANASLTFKVHHSDAI